MYNIYNIRKIYINVYIKSQNFFIKFNLSVNACMYMIFVDFPRHLIKNSSIIFLYI